MSQTKLNIVVRRLFTSVPKLVCFLQAAAIILAMAMPAGAVVTWTGLGSGTNLYWSTAANWDSNSVPLSTDDIVFQGTYTSPNYTGGTKGSASTVTNEVNPTAPNTTMTINSLTYNQKDFSSSTPGVVFHNTKIDPGKTLKISGSYTYPDTTYGISGPYSIYAGANSLSAGNVTSKTYFTGGGSLDISTSTGGNTGGDIVVREFSTLNDQHIALLDLSGLATFNANIDQLLIGYSSAGNTPYPQYQKATGSLYLARTNTITVNSTLNSPAQAVNSGAGLVIGFDPGNGDASGNSINQASSLYLGQTNTINVNTLWVGAPKSGGSLSFNPAFPNATLYMRGVNPTPGGDNTFIPVSYISIGDDSGGGSNASSGIVDLTGGTVDILATTIIVGRDGTVAQGNARPITGTLSFNGSISASTMSIGQHSFYSAPSTSATNCTGTVYIGNGSHLTVNGEMQMASFAGGTVGSATANLNISGGTVTMGGDIDKGVTPAGTPTNPTPATFPPPVGTSTASITLTGGTLDMGGHNIGTASVPIDYFTIHGGALNNVGNLSVTNFIAAGAVSPINGKVTIGNNGKIDMRDGAAHTVSAANMTLAGASTLYFELGSDTNIGDSDYINLNGGTLDVSSSGMSIFISRLGSSFAAAPNNTYTLISYGTHTGSSTLAFTNTTRSNMVPNLGANALTLTVTNVPGHDLTWAPTGGGSGTWDVINSLNKVWTSVQPPSPDMYYDTDNVTFGTQAGSSVITLNNTASSNGVVPTSVTVNSATDYTFNAGSSTDRISGTTGLTKLGTGTLYMNLANDYIGTTNLGTTLNPIAGKTVLGNANALGNASAPLIIASNATLDLNTYQLYAKPITVQGAGADGNGAIVNNSTTAPAGTQYDVSNVTLSGDTTIGGTSTIVTNSGGQNSGLPGHQYIGRWSFRAQTGQATITTTGSGQPYTLTKTGNNQIMLVDTAVDTGVGNVIVNEGVLSLESTTTLGNTNPLYSVTVDGSGAGQAAGGSILQLRNLTVPLNKQVTLKNNGQLYAIVNGSDTDNTVAGGVSIQSSGGILNAGGLRADYTSNTPNSSARININGPISGSGPMTKLGPGTVTLNNSSSTYNGTTTVNDGVLIVNGTLPGNITIAPIDAPGNPPIYPVTTVAPTLSGTGTVGATSGTVTVGGTTTSTFGGIVAPGPSNAAGSVGTLTLYNLTFNSTNTSNGGTINLDLSTNPSSGNDLLNISNNLSLSATAKTNIAINEISGPGSLTNGTYHLINYSGSKTGTALANLNLTGLTGGSRRTYALDDSVSHQINLNVGGASASLTWVGDGSTNKWDFANPSNTFWSGANPNIFYNLDAVTFTDSGNNAVPIDISSSTSTYVQPSSITVSAAKDYTFNGTSKITGVTGLSKSGTGKLILNNGNTGNTNDFSGPITINAGILQIGDGGTQYTSIGTGPITNSAQLIFNQYENHTVSGIISGSGSLEQKGSNSVITLSGANDYTGITLVSAGALQAGNNSALGSTVAGTTIASGATLDINNMNLGSEQITVQGPGVGSSLGGILCNGAIVNSNTSSSTTPQQALRFVTLTGDTTFGGQSAAGVANSGRWDIRGTTSSPSTLSTGGHGYNLTKTGNNQVSLVATTVDPMLANVNINQGILELELTSTLGNSSGIVTVDSSNATTTEPTETLDNGTLQFYNQATPLNKIIVLQNGGILYAKNNNLATDNTVAGPVTIADSGGILNAGGVRSDIATANANTTMTINGAISGSSSATLRKNGPGTVILNAATNTFGGTVNHTDGILIVNGLLPAAMNLTNNSTSTVRTTLSGTGTIGGATQDSVNTIIAPGANAALGTIGTLTFSSDLTLGYNGQGQINMDLSNNPSGTNDRIEVGGNLSLWPYTTVQINPKDGYLGVGTYHLIHYTPTSLYYGSASNLVLSGAPVDTRQTYSLSSATSHYVDLTVGGTAPVNLTWAGGVNFNAWDIKSTLNWTGASDHMFYNADQVTFDNTGSNSPAINITSTVLPGSVTVNSTQNYTFSGVGKISGGTSLTKNGAGTLTLATTNDYSGQTTVSAGTLLVTGGIGDNSPVLINGGTLQAGSNIALGTTNANGTTITSGTLDINAQNLQTEPITVQGAGVGSNGAIVNSGAAQTNALTQVTLSGNTTFGGSGEWDIRGTSATLSTGGSSYNLTKTGANTVQLVSVAVDTALGDININQGILKFQDSTTFGDPSKTVTIAAPGTLQFLASTNSMAKHIVSNGGTISASSTNSISQDIVSGTVTVNSTTTVNAANAAGILSFTNLISGNGGLDKTGPGTVIITGMPAYNGNTAIDGGILQINTVGSPVMHNVTGTAALAVGNGTSATNLTVDSISAGTLTISAGSTVTIAAIPGGPLAGMGSISPVPEPATWAMLVLAAMGLGIYRRRTR